MSAIPYLSKPGWTVSSPWNSKGTPCTSSHGTLLIRTTAEPSRPRYNSGGRDSGRIRGTGRGHDSGRSSKRGTGGNELPWNLVEESQELNDVVDSAAQRRGALGPDSYEPYSSLQGGYGRGWNSPQSGIRRGSGQGTPGRRDFMRSDSEDSEGDEAPSDWYSRGTGEQPSRGLGRPSMGQWDTYARDSGLQGYSSGDDRIEGASNWDRSASMDSKIDPEWTHSSASGEDDFGPYLDELIAKAQAGLVVDGQPSQTPADFDSIFQTMEDAMDQEQASMPEQGRANTPFPADYLSMGASTESESGTNIARKVTNRDRGMTHTDQMLASQSRWRSKWHFLRKALQPDGAQSMRIPNTARRANVPSLWADGADVRRNPQQGRVTSDPFNGTSTQSNGSRTTSSPVESITEFDEDASNAWYGGSEKAAPSTQMEKLPSSWDLPSDESGWWPSPDNSNDGASSSLQAQLPGSNSPQADNFASFVDPSDNVMLPPPKAATPRRTQAPSFQMGTSSAPRSSGRIDFPGDRYSLSSGREVIGENTEAELADREQEDFLSAYTFASNVASDSALFPDTVEDTQAEETDSEELDPRFEGLFGQPFSQGLVALAASSDDDTANLLSRYDHVVRICGVTFTAREEFRTYFRLMLQSVGEDESELTRMQQGMLLGLLVQGHRNPASKIGTGVVRIVGGLHPEYSRVCFFVERSDGSKIDFSYVQCCHTLWPHYL